MVSHLVKSIKGYGAKLYNVKTFVNLLNLRLGYINQLSPVDIYCDKVFEIAEIKKNYFAENLWIKDKDNKWTEPVEQYKITIINGKKSQISTMLYHLVNGTKIY
ncbi:hypothetical protein [Spiroplasma endosymbiont of Nebria brevicollis]|uniref:hypothetical protein n=1 Tax=Spiroplasma endosymbiont of Nebria brevicollis TaxID=3066284 RepID=UPI00313CB3D3